MTQLASGRTAVVTGASRGIGRAIALHLAPSFEHVVLVARDADGLHAAARSVSDAGACAHVLAIDLRDRGAAESAVAHALNVSGRIDAVVNNAGAVAPQPLLQMTDDAWEDGFAMKLHGARRLGVAAWPALKAVKGAMVFISGSSALAPRAALAAIATVNAAVNAVARAFADQGSSDGVQVNSVLPGPVVTERRLAMLERLAESRGLSLGDATLAFAQEAQVTRLGQPADIAALVAHLLSPAARWIHGAALRVDGGEAKAV